MTFHVDLTDPDLHEPKGASTAQSGAVYVANGAGGGTWTNIGLSSIDTQTVKGVGQYRVFATVADIANASSVYIPIAGTSRLDRVVGVISGLVTGGDAILSFKNNGGSTMGTLTVAASGSAAGNVYDVGIGASNTIIDGQYVRIDCDGGPTGGTSTITLTLLFTLV